MDGYVRDLTVLVASTQEVTSADQFNFQYSYLHNNLKLFHMNIRSTAENLDELLVYLEQLVFNFDIIVSTETFKIIDLKLYSLPGYDLLYNCGTLNRNDGVVLYIKHDIQYTFIS